jgi:two-component system response regulator QseB
MRLLLVDPRKDVREALAEGLRRHGHRVDAVHAVTAFMARVAPGAHDAYLVSAHLPDTGDVQLFKWMRRLHITVPVLHIGRRGAVWTEDIASMPSPADMEALAEAVRRILQPPVQHERGTPLRLGNVSLHEATGEVFAGLDRLNLRPMEFRLLENLMRRPGIELRKDTLIEVLSEPGERMTPNALEATMSRLRRALEPTNADIEIETIRGRGYRVHVLGGR